MMTFAPAALNADPFMMSERRFGASSSSFADVQLLFEIVNLVTTFAPELGPTVEEQREKRRQGTSPNLVRARDAVQIVGLPTAPAVKQCRLDLACS